MLKSNEINHIYTHTISIATHNWVLNACYIRWTINKFALNWLLQKNRSILTLPEFALQILNLIFYLFYLKPDFVLTRNLTTKMWHVPKKSFFYIQKQKYNNKGHKSIAMTGDDKRHALQKKTTRRRRRR